MKRFIALFLTISLSLAIFAFAADKTPSQWAKGEVQMAEGVGIAKTKYDYQAPITREKFCELIYNYLNIIKIEFNHGENTFADTENKKVIALSNLEIVNGRAEGKFVPDATLTREEAATILARVVNNVHPLKATGMTGNWIVFYDEAEFSDWAKFNIQNMYKYGIMGGVGVEEMTIGVNGGSESIVTRPVFDPKGTFTAEQAIATVLRLYNMTDPDLIKRDGTFADRMYAQMPNDKNYTFSPLSIKMALLLAANGAEGDTALEILNAIDVENLDAYNAEIKELINKYSQSEFLTLNVSNSVWINRDNTDMSFSSAYQNKVKEFFGATADVVGNNDALKKVNGWVNEKTKGKISSIINDTDFWSLLVNAVYFKGRWADEFHPSNTRKDVFFTRSGDRTTIDFMNKTDWMQRCVTDGVTIVELPYLTREDKFDDDGRYMDTVILEGMDVSMYLMMADKEFSPEKILKSAELSSGYVSLSMPKFKIEFSTEFNGMLKSLGINRAFTNNAQFSKMFDTGNVWIDKTIHKTYIDVNEEGTEAAAVTAMAEAGSALPPEPEKIKFDRPFTFVIKDNVSGEILFMGEYAY